MGKASRQKSSQSANGISPAVAKRIAAAERRAAPPAPGSKTQAERVHDYELPPAARLEALLDPGSDVAGSEGREEIGKVHQLLTQRGWELSAVDFDVIAWDAPIDEQARRLIHSDEKYGEPIASVLTDVLFEVPVFTLGLPHRGPGDTPPLSFMTGAAFAPLLDEVEAFHIDDDATGIVQAASGAVDLRAIDRGPLVSTTPAEYIDYGDSDEA